MKTLIGLMMACSLCTAQAAPKERLSDNLNGSQLSTIGAVSMVAGSIETVIDAGTLVVKGVEKAGDSVVVIVEGTSNAGRASFRLSGAALDKTSVAVGDSLSVVAMASGHALVAAGQVLAFFPNEVGKALIHHSRYQAPGK